MCLFGPVLMLIFFQQKSSFQCCVVHLLIDSLVLIYLNPSQINSAGPHPRLIALLRPRMRRRRIKGKQSRGMAEIAMSRRIRRRRRAWPWPKYDVLGSDAAKRKYLLARVTILLF